MLRLGLQRDLKTSHGTDVDLYGLNVNEGTRLGERQRKAAYARDAAAPSAASTRLLQRHPGEAVVRKVVVYVVA